jgi:hypothetical protein
MNPIERGKKVSNLLWGKQLKRISFLLCSFLAGTVLWSSDGLAAMPDPLKAIYLPPYSLTERKITEISHYAALTGLNAVVLHVKDPYGRIRWKSNNQLARKMGAIASTGLVEHSLRQLKKQGFWCIAKLDVFADHRLVYHNPYLGILDIRTGGPWQDKNGLYWANPHNRKVWEYNIALSRELVALGFDEIQFDYIRFPSDGDLTVTHYPVKLDKTTKIQCIGKFLEQAYRSLKPTGVTISIDVFGLVAWKTKDFGVGQNIEAMAPYVDVICPMLYPSHFPPGFIGMQYPAERPVEIMELSTKRMQKRTGKKIRPWIQGFWYAPEDIVAQIDGLCKADTGSWSVWNPSGNYSTTYAALAIQLNQEFPEPQFYPSVADLDDRVERVIPGKSRIINLTSYKQGYTIISLEKYRRGSGKSYATLNQVLATLEEGIMDRILTARRIPFSRFTPKSKKKSRLVALLCADLQIDPRALRPKPIYIDWKNDCKFTPDIPRDRLSNYRIAAKTAFVKDRDVYAKFPNRKSANPSHRFNNQY